MRLQWWGWDRLRYEKDSDRVRLNWWGWDRQTCNREGEGLVYRLVGDWDLLEAFGRREVMSCVSFSSSCKKKEESSDAFKTWWHRHQQPAPGPSAVPSTLACVVPP